MKPAHILLVLIITTAPGLAETTCPGPSAHIDGGYTVAVMGARYEYTQSMTLRYAGSTPPYGRWIGVEHVQHMWNSVAMAPEVMAGVSATPDEHMPGVQAVCDTTVPDAHTIIVTCQGQYPFTMHRSGAVTWEGQSDRIGTINTSPDAPYIQIDMLANMPGYQAQATVDTSMAGALDQTQAYQFRPRFTERVLGQSGGSTYSEIEMDLTVTPEASGVTLTGVVNQGPGTVTPLGQDGLLIRLYGETSAARMTAAGHVALTGRLDHTVCPMTGNWRLSDLLLVAGVQP